jgi:anaerobic magnesium-protoporphyrin IX monomethyl ester cyclase
MSQPVALFVGYEDQENLGLRSIIATLRAAGFQAELQPYTPNDPSGVLAAIETYNPDLIGFSIIFQYTLDEFRTLTARLRDSGVRAHFTVGGHFPSLRPRDTLEALPHIDSVVRFEGELTALELLRKLHQPESWPGIQGLAFRQGKEITLTPIRPLIPDLDSLPPPMRDRPRLISRGIRVASLLASRGCLYNCAFCSIRQFYGSAPGPLRRVRSPKAVVEEMRVLFERDGVRFFIFQDDDFAARSQAQRRWVNSFLRALNEAKLTGHVRWKISCRVDDVDEELITRCRDHGLIAVYLGVESGSPAGLKTLNKRVTVEQNYAAIETLKKTGTAFEMGFMLFDPDSTLETVQENILFLRQTLSDGSCPVNFCKMLPYAGTPIEARLKKENRLKGTISQPDYDFLDPRLDWFALFAAQVFRFRNFDLLGLVERLRFAKFDQVLAQTFGDRTEEYSAELQAITSRANALALDTLTGGLEFVSSRDEEEIPVDWSLLGYLADQEWREEIALQYELDRVLARHSPELMQAFAEQFSQRFQGDRQSEFAGMFADL